MNKSLLSLLVLFLGLSFVLSSIAAVPTSRSLKSIKENPALQDLQAQGIMVEEGDVIMLTVEGVVEGRVVLETRDYPGTGANHHHDPWTPGRPV